ncbi:MAG: VWA domain-containing protein, partial [Streptosporangiaceae bacterium]
RRTHTSGRLHVRKTLRRAVAAGGVPLDPAWHQRRKPRPQLIVLCDVSGSVAEFAKFTLSLLHALHAELPRLRSFVFADGVAEVTELVESSLGVIDTRLLLSRPGVVRRDGHSDYGAVLWEFLGRHGGELTANCVLIICGDARSNYRPARPDLLHAISRRVRQVHWLNPEPKDQWDAGDSRIGEYRRDCDTLAEVRNLRQLSAWVDMLL